MTNLSSRSRSDLLALLRVSCGFVSEMDSLWFLAMQESYGREEAVKFTIRVRERYTQMLVKRVKNQLGLSGSGIEMMRQVIEADPFFLANDYEISHLSRDRMFLRVNMCASVDGMERPRRKELMCEATTAAYFRNLAKEIEAKVTVHAIRVPPGNSPDEPCCEWLFEAQPPAATNPLPGNTVES